MYMYRSCQKYNINISIQLYFTLHLKALESHKPVHKKKEVSQLQMLAPFLPDNADILYNTARTNSIT